VALGTRRTSNAGTARFALRPKANAFYRWTFAGSAADLKSTSRALPVRVTQIVTASLQPRHITTGNTSTLAGTLTPAGARKVYLQRLVKGRWRSTRMHTVAAVLLMPNGTRAAGYAFVLTAHRVGKYRFRVYRPATATLAAGYSRTVTLTVPR
jgi:hypothetical protein